jgi:hypothetical protein
MTENIENIRLPKLIAFDLDGTIWSPEMYELWGGGYPFKGDGNSEMKDCRGRSIRLLGETRAILSALKNNPTWSQTKVAWVISFVYTFCKCMWNSSLIVITLGIMHRRATMGIHITRHV